jgi:hypothetical protein
LGKRWIPEKHPKNQISNLLVNPSEKYESQLGW